MIANALLLAWALGWGFLLRDRINRQGSDPLDAVAFSALVGFPAICVAAARHLP